MFADFSDESDAPLEFLDIVRIIKVAANQGNRLSKSGAMCLEGSYFGFNDGLSNGSADFRRSVPLLNGLQDVIMIFALDGTRAIHILQQTRVDGECVHREHVGAVVLVKKCQ